MTDPLVMTLNPDFIVLGEEVTVESVDRFKKTETKTELTNHFTPVPVERSTRFVRLHFKEDIDPVEMEEENVMRTAQYIRNEP